MKSTEHISKTPRSYRAVSYLSLFGLTITVPLLMLLGALLFQSASAQRAQLEARVVQVLEALVNDIDRDLDRDITILHTLATSEALASADWRTFYDRAKAGLQGRAYLVLVESNGRQLVNTYLPYGEQPAMTGDPETLRRILQSKAPAVSNLFVSLVVKRPVFNVSIPVLRDGQVRYVMSLGLLPDDLVELLKSQQLGAEWVTLIWDANGVILARSRDSMRYAGTPMPANMREHAQRAIDRTTNLDGIDVLHATARSRVSGWGVGVNIPYSLVVRQMRDSILLWGAASVVAITIALLSGVFFARQITRSLSVAAGAAAAFGADESFPITGSRLKEADAFLRTLKDAQQARESLTDQIKQSRDWLQTTLNSIGDAVITTDADGRLSSLNGVAQSLTGWKQEEAAGKRLEEVFVIRNAETGLEVESPVSKVLREGRIVGLANHARLIAKDGRVTPIDDSAAPIRDGNKVAGVVLVFRDITERLKAEEHMRLTVEAAPNAMIMVSRTGEIELVNSQTEKLFGYRREELLGQRVEILVPERYRAGHGALRTSFLHEPSARPMGAGRDLFGLRNDGTEVPIEIGLNPISTGQGEFVLAAIIDISERKRAEERLRTANEELSRTNHLLERVACFVRDLQDRIIYWNPGATELYGFSPTEAIGNVSHSLLRTEFPVPVDAILTQMRTAGAWDGELLHTRRDGQRITVASHWVLHKDSDGRPIAILQANLDITERIRAEEELRKLNAALSRANEDLSHFAFAASHDLQEPLRVITSYAQLLIKGYRGQLDDEASLCVHFITEGTKRMRALLADLLAYTQVTSEEQKPTESVDLNLLFQKVLENLKAAIEESGAIVTSEPLPVVEGHEAHFIQLFQNLVDNGIKYHGDHTPRIHISVKTDSDAWRVAVADNGIGIAPAYHETVFSVFKRLHGKSIPGTGIGLAVCQRVVERYGGRIWVESDGDGHGSTFCFTLSDTTGAGA